MLNSKLMELAEEVTYWYNRDKPTAEIFQMIVCGLAGQSYLAEDYAKGLVELFQNLGTLDWDDIILLQKWLKTLYENIETEEQLEELVDYFWGP